jgi:hypothetical protein
MRVLVEGRTYESTYFPFFLKKQRLDYSIYTFRLPSGVIEEIFVFDRNNYLQELQDYVKYMIEQFCTRRRCYAYSSCSAVEKGSQ